MSLIKVIDDRPNIKVEYGVEGYSEYFPSGPISVYENMMSFTEGARDIIIPFHKASCIKFTRDKL